MMLGLIASDLLLQRQQAKPSSSLPPDRTGNHITESDDRTKAQPVVTPAPAEVEDLITIDDDDDNDSVEPELVVDSTLAVDRYMNVDTDQPLIQPNIREQALTNRPHQSSTTTSSKSGYRKRKRVIDDEDDNNVDSNSSDNSPRMHQATSTKASNKSESVSTGAPAADGSSRAKRTTANYNTVYIDLEDTDESGSDSEVNVKVEASSKRMKGPNSNPLPKPMPKPQPTIISVARVSILERPKKKNISNSSNSASTNLKPLSASSSASDPTHPTQPTTVQTLIICPMTLISQWVEEIRTKLAPGVMSVFMYYGNERHMNSDQLRKHDVIVTSYGTLISDAKIHQKHLASIDSTPSIKSLLSPFHNAPNTHSSSSSSDRRTPTAATVAAGVSAGKGLFGIAWHRVVLDEAHTIKVSILWMWAII